MLAKATRPLLCEFSQLLATCGSGSGLLPVLFHALLLLFLYEA